MRLLAAIISLSLCIGCGNSESPRTPPVSDPTANSTNRKLLWQRFDNPKKYAKDIRPGKSGPADSDFEDAYRSLLQLSKKAVKKGFPSHAEAEAMILADAKIGSDRTDQHLLWVCFIKKFSQKYRPEEATESLRRIYKELINLKYPFN